jgi:PAS domain S-box-containing protein
MAISSHRIEQLVEDLARDPGFEALRDGAAVLVWSSNGTNVLWANAAARNLRLAVANSNGLVRSTVRGREQLRRLAAGAAPRQGTRLERLWLDPGWIAPPVTCACRLASVDNEDVLVTMVVGQVPDVTLPAEEPVQAAPDPAPKQVEEPPAGPVRFVWQMDAQTRFIQVSDDLARIVGPMSADVLGMTWSEVAASVVDDASGEIAGLLRDHKTWSGRRINWSLDNRGGRIPVDWAGMPVYGSNRSVVGFRGFGLLQVDSVAEDDAEPSASTAMIEDAQEIEEHALVGEDPVPSDPSWFDDLRDRVAASLSQPPAMAPAEVPPSAPPSAGLSTTERNAFREIARALGARVDEPAPTPAPVAAYRPVPAEPPPAPVEIVEPPQAPAQDGRLMLESIPAGVVIYRQDRLLFANRVFLELAGFDDVDAAEAAGGLPEIFRGSPTLLRSGEGANPVALMKRNGESEPVSVAISSIEWERLPASLMLVRPADDALASQKARAAEMALRARESRVQELEAILDTATDGVIAFDESGRILSLNRSAEALFGYEQGEVFGDMLTVLLAPASHAAVLGYLENLRSPGVASLLNDGREVLGRERQGGTIPLFMTVGAINQEPGRKFCAVVRDMTAFKRAETELLAAKQGAEEASAQKSDLLAKISHEIRTPLNAIIGFAEVMLEERFGPIGNERYKDYLKDVHASGAHVISLVNDLLDLAKIEAGHLELSFSSVNLNDLISSCVSLLQPQAARQRIVMRTSFAERLPPVVADERSIRQIVLNLLSNAIKFTDAGGQVIVSSALTDKGEAAFRVRDTGIGMNPEEVEAALEPFRQLATAAHRRGGTGLGLPLTKALVEANRGALRIESQPSEGTLVEVLFPPTRVLAE